MSNQLHFMRKFIPCLLLCMSLPAHCEVKVEVSCFSSGGERPIRFELRTYYDDQAKWSGAFVRYEKSYLLPIWLFVRNRLTKTLRH
jgi:hypothetical protein